MNFSETEEGKKVVKGLIGNGESWKQFVDFCVNEGFKAGQENARKEFIENNADIQEGQLKIYIDNAKEAERQKVLDEVEKIIDEWLEEQKTCEGNIYKNWRQYSPADMLNLKNKLKSFMKR